MAHRPTDEAGAPSPFAVIGLRSMTSAERAAGRFMRAPDHGDDGGLPPADAVGDDPVKRLEATLGGEDEEEILTGDEPADDIDEDADDTAAADDTTDDEEEPAKPAITPPVSWKADMKEKFAELPPEVAEYIAQRDSETSRALQVKATEASEARTARTQAEDAIGQLHSHYSAQLEQFLSSTAVDAPDPAWLDVATYGDEGPQAFYQQQALYQADQAQRHAAQLELDNARQRQSALSEQQRRDFLTTRHSDLSGENGIEGWGDPARQPKIAEELLQFATAHGYAEQLGVADAQDLKFLHFAMGLKVKADKYDALQKQKMAVVRQARDLPKTAKPNAAQPHGSAQTRATQQQRDRLRSSGDVRDAASLIASRL